MVDAIEFQSRRPFQIEPATVHEPLRRDLGLQPICRLLQPGRLRLEPVAISGLRENRISQGQERHIGQGAQGIARHPMLEDCPVGVTRQRIASEVQGLPLHSRENGKRHEPVFTLMFFYEIPAGQHFGLASEPEQGLGGLTPVKAGIGVVGTMAPAIRTDREKAEIDFRVQRRQHILLRRLFVGFGYGWWHV